MEKPRLYPVHEIHPEYRPSVTTGHAGSWRPLQADTTGTQRDPMLYHQRTSYDAFMARVTRELEQLPRVRRLIQREQDGIDTLVVVGDNLSLQDIDAITDIQWNAIEAYPGRYVHIELHDEFGR